uniref:ATP synthase F0 subunit 8 n=1 Tax=Trixa longipennis TaxID=3025371 RepID=UPI0023AA5986|nr:ATP synthase F0 subunit 8 [Trixa longipennis]WCL18813.1 ATP synthase F0 subunit 8 [Trixa longipennis]
MPQMSPINWLSMFIMFSMLFLIFNLMNYYSFNPLMPKSNILNEMNIKPSLNWKW